jgi:NitT/TauT family transport system substrate-binding protein
MTTAPIRLGGARSQTGCKLISRRSVLREGAMALGVLAVPTPCHVAPSFLRVSSLRFGSLSWLLDTIRDQRIDAKLAVDIEVVDVATSQAGPVALLAGDVDVIVSDWIWALRQRSEGEDLLFAPYSSALGALMVPAGSPVRSLADLVGRRLGVAGGPIDKSWLLLRAYSRRTIGRDIADVARPVFGAAPLLTEEIRNGRLDAVLNFWTFAARLQGSGFVRLLDMAAVLKLLGIEPAPTLVGFVFRQRSLMAKRTVLEAFFTSVADGNAVLAHSDAAWERLRPLVQPATDAELAAIRSFYRAGIPGPWGEAETRSAERLFDMLAALGDKELVGARTRFDAKLFHSAG